MKNKVVFFGRIKTIQVKCPKCKEWQFKSKKCSECGFNFKDEHLEKDKTEYRSEPSTWREKIKDSVKKIIFEKDEYICQYCGIWCYESYIQNKKSLTIDHLIPFSENGSNEIDNLITCCRECNLIKHNKRFKTFEDARKYILKRKKYETI